MTELKTLKELINHWNCNRDCSAVSDFIEYELKQEAIKWIKYFKQIESLLLMHQEEIEKQNKIVGWIKHFFNITEEDLI